LTPPPHAYNTSNSYTLKLAAKDAYGCTDTARIILQVAALPTIDFTGLTTPVCSDKTVSLTRVVSSNIVSYTWDNGNGVTIQNQAQVQFNYSAEGAYTITLTGTDKYCGNAVVSKPVQVFAVPKINLGNDTILCPATPLLIGVPSIAGYTYLWNTGATTSQIAADNISSTYTL